MKVFATAAWFKHLGSPFARMIFAATIAGACTFLNVYCTQPLLPFFQRLFHASEVEVSLTVGAVTLSVALMAPLIGLAAETLGRKKIIVLALFAMGIVSLLTATSNDLHGMIFWRFAQGLFVPGVIAVIMAFINEEFPAHAGIVMSVSLCDGNGFRRFSGPFSDRFDRRSLGLAGGLYCAGRFGPFRRVGRATVVAVGRSFCVRQELFTIVRRYSGSRAESETDGRLLHGVHRVIFIGGRIYLCQFLFG